MKIKIGLPKLNNIKVRNKLLMIYLLCIVVPVLATNIIFALRIINSVKMENIDQCNGIMDTVQLNVSKEFENIINLSSMIYTDSSLDKALERDYTGVVEKVDVYTYFRDYMSRIRSMYTQIDSVSIYSDNKTIPLGGNAIFNKLSLNSLSWYPSIDKSGKSVVFLPYTQDGKKYLSVLRRMDYFYNSKSQKIMKIDVNFNDIIGYLKNNSGRWDIYLVNSGNDIILSSSDSINRIDSFVSFGSVRLDRSDSLITRDLGKYDVLRGWRLVGVFRQEQLYESLRQSGWFVAAMALLDLFAATAIILLISRSLNKRLKLVATHMGRHDLKKLDCEEGADEIGEVIREYNLMTQKIQDMITNEYEYSIEIKNAELERKQAVINALQSQINPHFLFNTLETIRMRSALKNEDETAAIIKSLSKIFRRMLTWKEDLIPLKEEISFVEDYLKLQKYRFGDKVNYRVDVGPGAEDVRIPKMTIQPFVENACIHGLESIAGDGMIAVRATLERGMLGISVTDNGKGIGEERLSQILCQVESEEKGGSIGIRNVCNRLKLLFGGEFHFSMQSSPGEGTAVFLSIPAEEQGGAV